MGDGILLRQYTTGALVYADPTGQFVVANFSCRSPSQPAECLSSDLADRFVVSSDWGKTFYSVESTLSARAADGDVVVEFEYPDAEQTRFAVRLMPDELLLKCAEGPVGGRLQFMPAERATAMVRESLYRPLAPAYHQKFAMILADGRRALVAQGDYRNPKDLPRWRVFVEMRGSMQEVQLTGPVTIKASGKKRAVTIPTAAGVIAAADESGAQATWNGVAVNASFDWADGVAEKWGITLTPLMPTLPFCQAPTE